MPSPFPGMDPFLEYYMWPDTHASLALVLKIQINTKLPPELIAWVEVNTYTEDVMLKAKSGGKPDASILDRGLGDRVEEPASPYGQGTPATVETEIVVPVEVRQYTVQIRHKDGETLVAAIEILSPTNKKNPNLTAYRQKRMSYLVHGAHLLELDLLREGTRPVLMANWPKSTYSVQLINAHRGKLRFWGLSLSDKLPDISLPLRVEDTPILLDLNLALASVYDTSRYGTSIDYKQPLKGPPLSKNDQTFLESLDLD